MATSNRIRSELLQEDIILVKADKDQAMMDNPDLVVYTDDEVDKMSVGMDEEMIRNIHMVKKFFNGDLVKFSERSNDGMA